MTPLGLRTDLRTELAHAVFGQKMLGKVLSAHPHHAARGTLSARLGVDDATLAEDDRCGLLDDCHRL